MITKSTTEPRKLPTASADRTLPSGAVRRGICRARHSPPPTKSPMMGISRSATTEDTTLPIAAPMTTATARASALVFRRKSKNPVAMALLLHRGLLGDDLSLDLRVGRLGEDVLRDQLVLALVGPVFDDLLGVDVADALQLLELVRRGGVDVDELGLGRGRLGLVLRGVGFRRLRECRGCPHES